MKETNCYFKKLFVYTISLFFLCFFTNSLTAEESLNSSALTEETEEQLNKELNEQFMSALVRGDILVVKALLVKGADVNSKNSLGRTALMCVSEIGYTEIAQELLANGADVNFQVNNGWTALMLAILNHNTEIVKLLLQYEVDVNARTRYGMTALSKALALGHVEIVRLLKTAGATE